jgi:hypothetical protein
MDRAYTFQVKKVENNKFLKRKDSLKNNLGLFGAKRKITH